MVCTDQALKAESRMRTMDNRSEGANGRFPGSLFPVTYKPFDLDCAQQGDTKSSFSLNHTFNFVDLCTSLEPLFCTKLYLM